MCQTCSTTGAAVAGVPTAHTVLDPFVPNVSILRFPNGIFELHLYLPGVVSKVEVVPHNNYLLVRGNVAWGIRQDIRGRAGALVYTDQVNGEFSRDVPICLSPGTDFVVLETRQECNHYIVRYTIRNSIANAYCNTPTPAAQVINNNVNNNSYNCANVTNSFTPVAPVNNNFVNGGNVQGGCHGARVAPIINMINTPRGYITASIC